MKFTGGGSISFEGDFKISGEGVEIMLLPPVLLL